MSYHVSLHSHCNLNVSLKRSNLTQSREKKKQAGSVDKGLSTYSGLNSGLFCLPLPSFFVKMHFSQGSQHAWKGIRRLQSAFMSN